MREIYVVRIKDRTRMSDTVMGPEAFKTHRRAQEYADNGKTYLKGQDSEGDFDEDIECIPVHD